MKQDVVIQVRVNQGERDQANEILKELNTNISSVVNMLLKQVILTRSIPFSVALPPEEPVDSQVTENTDAAELANDLAESYTPPAPISGSYADTSDIDKYVDLFDKPDNRTTNRFGSSGSDTDAFSDFINMGISGDY